MDVHSSTNPLHNGSAGHSMETPTKKQKMFENCELKTAESPSLSTEKHSPTIADVDAEELFSNFSKIVVVTEEEEEF